MAAHKENAMSVTVEKLKRGPDYAVMLDRRRVGTIRHRPDGWAYNPAHTKVFGDTFPSVRDCLESLRNPAPESADD